MNPLTIAGVILVVIPSITSHEAAHGLVADRLGDPTAREAGRLTLNPIPHIDLFFTILLPAFLILSGAGFIFGGAKPVPVNVSRLRNPRRDWALVGAAGPLTNVAFAILFSAVLSLFLHTGLWSVSSIGTEVLSVGIFVNVLLAIFNLVPIPPLDGSRIVQYFLSGDALRVYRGIERYGLLVIVALVFFIPPFQMFLTRVILDSMAIVTGAFGVSQDVALVLRGVLLSR
jgi:Zn-dependent protease